MTSRPISRKEFLGIGAGATAGIAIAGSGMATFLAKEATAATPPLKPFVDALPVPPTLTGANLSLRIRQTTQRFHPDLPLTPVWGYNGGGYDGYLGPTVEAVKGTPTSVSYVNELPATHLLKVDPTITQMKGKLLNSRILTHLHGGHISPEADGNPFTSADVARGGTQTVEYANDQEAAHIWYHDHAMGITRLNVMAGLAGHYLLRDEVDDGGGGNFPAEPGTGLPYGKYEVPLAIQDRTFTRRGKLAYPAQWTPEFFGDVVTVNGKVWPHLRVEPRKYRFRVLNGSNSRFYNLKLTGGATMTQIGTDGGLLPRPVQIGSLLIAPGERADVVIDFAGLGGNVDLVDTALPATTVSPATPLARPQIMRFKVRGTATVADKPLPERLREAPFSVPGGVTQERFVTLEEVMAGPVPKAVLLNGMRFHERPVTERPRLGTTEVWTIVNLSADTHPIHLHQVQFEVLERRALDAEDYQAALDAARAAAGGPVDANGRLVNPDPEPSFLGASEPVEANERGPKDTVRANPAQITRVRANFDIAGGYVWHCHILEHEDNDMMRPFEVV